MKNYRIIPTIHIFEDLTKYQKLFSLYGKENIAGIKVNTSSKSLDLSEENCERLKHIKEYFSAISGGEIKLYVDIPYPGTKFFAQRFGGENGFQIEKGCKYRIISREDEKIRGDIIINHKEFIQKAQEDELIYFQQGVIQAQIIEKKENYLLVCAEKKGELSDGFQVSQKNLVFFRNLSREDMEKAVEFIIKADIDFPLLSYLSASYDLFEFNMALSNKGRACGAIPRLETSDGKYVMEDYFSFNEIGCLGRENLRDVVGEKEFPYNYHGILKEARRFKQRIIMEIQYNYQRCGEELKLDENCLLDLYWLVLHGINEFILSESMSRDINKFIVFLEALSRMIENGKRG